MKVLMTFISLTQDPTPRYPLPSMALTTDAIREGGMIDPRYTCDIDNSSPELRWNHVPDKTKEFALIVEDLDHPIENLTHWIVYHIPGHIHHLPAGIPPQEALPNGIRQGINAFGKLGYTGPCPPIGDRPHRYRFRVFSLKDHPILAQRIQRDELLSTILPLILAQAEITGKYRRILQKAG